MTDFSRNQINSVRVKDFKIDPWVVPNDRQLILRARLGTGWSSRANSDISRPISADQKHCILSDDELEMIKNVVEKADTFEKFERTRIGNLVGNLERLRQRSLGDGRDCCKLCGKKFSFRSNSHTCTDCSLLICGECSLETLNSKHRNILLCKLCSEHRELWKKSGAWFYGTVPAHDKPADPTPSNKPIQRARRNISPVPMISQSMLKRLSAVSAEYNQPDEYGVTKFIKTNAGSSSDDSDNDSIVSNENYNELFKSHTNKEFDFDCCSDITVDRISHSRSVTPVSIHVSNHDEQEQPATVTKSGGVKFSPDVSESPQTSRRNSLYARCESIPNADLNNVQYHDVDDQDSPLGSLIFTIFYDELKQKMNVEVLSAKNLPRDPCSAYVSLRITPSIGQSWCLRTKTAHHTSKADWKETCVYHGVSENDILHKSLILTVLEEKLVGNDPVIGEFRLSLKQMKSYELTQYHVYLEKSHPVLDISPNLQTDERGRILVSLKYETIKQKLTVKIMRCAGLVLPSYPDYLLNPYVKLYLQPDYSKSSKKKTGVVKKCLHPCFEEEFSYTVDLNSLIKRSLDVTVWDYNIIKNTLIGGISLTATNQISAEKDHWIETLTKVNTEQERWHVLRQTA